jgi:hypothetical protein
VSKTHKQRLFGRIDTLKRRAEHLQARLERQGYSGMDFDKQELSALEWAIPILEARLVNHTLSRMSPRARAGVTGLQLKDSPSAGVGHSEAQE